jgi:hypothetical protein
VVLATGRDASPGDAVPERGGIATDAEAGAQRVVLRLAHAFGAARDHDIGDAGLHAHGGVDDRLQSRTATPVQLQPRHVHAQAGIQCRDAPDGGCLSVRIALAEDDVVDDLRVQLRTADQLSNHRLGQFNGGDVAEHAAVLAHRGAQRLANDCISHGFQFSWPPGRCVVVEILLRGARALRAHDQRCVRQPARSH